MSSNATVRECSDGDEALLSLVGQATFLEAFAGMLDGKDLAAHCANQHSDEIYRKWLRDDRVKIWLAEAGTGKAPVGYLVLTPPEIPVPDPRNDDIEVKRVYLLVPFQGSGLGKKLMEIAEESAKNRGYARLLLGVYSGNSRAIGFYRRLGFTQVGTRSFQVGYHHYQDLVLAKKI